MLEVDLSVEPVWDAQQDWQTLSNRAVAAAIAVAPYTALSEGDLNISVSIRFADNAEVQKLNREYRDKDAPTNVLSFPMMEGHEFDALLTPLPFRGGAGGGGYPQMQRETDSPHPNPSSKGEGLIFEETLLGDIILAHETCAAEAVEMAIPLPHHVTHLIIHGTLHLLGYDHIDEHQGDVMEELEVKALASMGLGNPYD
jgi:probable rRNA maturation factor